MVKLLAGILLLVFALQGFASEADKLKGEVKQLCEKTRACALAEVKKSLPENMHAMAEGMIEGVCASVEQNYTAAYTDNNKAVYTDAITCVSSMNKLSCEQLMSGEETPACTNYSKTVEDYEN